MRQILTFLGVLLLLSSCGNRNNGKSSETQTADSIQSIATTGATALNDYAADSTLKADATTGATAVANAPTMNGIIVLMPQNLVTVTLPMSGTITQASLLTGDYVKKGSVIAKMANPEFINLQQTYLDSHAQAEFLEKEYLRQNALSKNEAASKKLAEQSKADYLSMKSRMDGAAAQLTLLGLNTSELLTKGISPYLEVKAPISGFISDMNLNVGKHIAAGEALCDIMDKSNPVLKLTAYEKELSKFKVGDKLLFHVNGMRDSVFHADIISVGQSIDMTNRSLYIYARIRERNDKFSPGMYVTAYMDRTDTAR